MAYQLLERPHRFSFSKNPVRYLFNITNPGAPGAALEVELYTLGIDGALAAGEEGTLITRQILYPNPDGKVEYYCEDFLHSWLEWELPAAGNNNVVALKQQIRKFYVRYRQITSSNATPPWQTDAANMRVVLKGGVAKEKFDRNNFFVNYLPTEKPFLTWQPADHFIGTEERRYLTYFHDDDADLPVLFLKARVVYTDGAQETVSIAFPALAESLLFLLPAGLQQLGLYDLHPDKMIWYYDVSVEDAAGNVFAKPYRLNADYRKFYDVFSFVYANSISGIDTIRIRGEFDVQINRDYTEIQKAITGTGAGTLLPTENDAINISKYEKYTGDVGWLNTRRMQDSLQDLLLSEFIFQQHNDRWLKVVLQQKTQEMGNSDDTRWSFPLQWRYTFDNSQYTPVALDFGSGVYDEPPGELYGSCTAPGNLTANFLNKDVNGTTYRFTWDAVADAQSYELEFKKEVDTVWTVVPTAVNEADVVFPEDGDYNWRVRTQCGVADFSAYANGAGFTVIDADAVCAAPDSIAVLLLNLNGNNATVRFRWPDAADVVGYYVEWRAYGAPNWNQNYILKIDFVEPYYDVDLQKDVQYEFRVRSKCNASGDMSGYVYGNNFIPSNLVGSCNAPTNLSFTIPNSSIDQTRAGINGFRSVIFNWTAAAGGSGYELQYRIKGALNWTIADNVNSGYLTTAYNDKIYEWRLRTHCAGGGYSNFANGPDFDTTL